MFKKILFLALISLLFLLPLVGEVQARRLEVIYPDIPGAERIDEDTTLSGYLEYVYYFVISLTGIAGLIVLIWGGLIYLTSAGSPDKMKEGVGRIIGGLSGIAIVLFAHLILTTINPGIFGLVTQRPDLPSEGYCLRGHQVRWRDECPSRSVETSPNTCEEVIGSAPHVDYKCCQIERTYCFDGNVKDLAESGFIPREINFRSKEVKIHSVFFFEETDYQGTSHSVINGAAYMDYWREIGAAGISFIRSVHPIRLRPGFTVFPVDDCQYDFSDYDKNMPTQAYSGFVPEFSKEALSVLRVPRGGTEEDWFDFVSWGGVFFDSTEYHGKCQIIFKSGASGPGQNPNCFLPEYSAQIGSRIEARSAYIFRRDLTNNFSGQVTFCPQLNYEPIELLYRPAECHTVTASHIINENKDLSIWTINDPMGQGDWAGGAQENILSVKIDGKFLVVLSSEPDFTGNCTFLIKDEPNLIGSHVIGDTTERRVRSIAIIPLQ